MSDTNKQQDAKATAAVRHTAEAAEQVGGAAGEALRQGADSAADIARRNSDAGAEALRRAGEAASETARRGGQAVVESQRRIVQDAADRFEEVSRKIAEATQGTTENVRRLFTLPNAAEGGLRDIQQGVVGLVEGVVQTNLRVAQELFRLSQPGAHRRAAAALRARVHGHAGAEQRHACPRRAPHRRRDAAPARGAARPTALPDGRGVASARDPRESPGPPKKPWNQRPMPRKHEAENGEDQAPPA